MSTSSRSSSWWLVVVALMLSSACTPIATGTRRQHPLLGQESGREPPTSTTSLRSPFDDPLPDDGDVERQSRLRLAAAAAASVGDRPLIVGGVRYRFDCSGVAAGIYAKAGFRVDDGTGSPSTRALYDVVRLHGSLRRDHPLPGDLVFFDDTWDSNGNGLRDDPLSHVGVVEKIFGDGTVLFVHRIGGKIVRWRLNPKRPRDRTDDSGRPLNQYLRDAEGAFPAQTTGELFVAFGSLPARPLPARVADAR
jgi:hypothetical protein